MFLVSLDGICRGVLVGGEVCLVVVVIVAVVIFVVVVMAEVPEAEPQGAWVGADGPNSVDDDNSH